MPTITTFNKLGLAKPVLDALTELGYETPTPVQAQSVPVLMDGSDLLAQAQTGTGKTAAFALPILSNLDLSLKKPQALVIAPTRELAIQVAEAFQSYAKYLKGFHVLPIYGGQDYQVQLRGLKRGAQVIVGTPGRVMDHLRRGTLTLEALETVVLDEADEMLKMGFQEDTEWILEQVPHEHQVALFSATMPASIQKISKRYLKDAVKIQIKAQAGSVESIEQSYMCLARGQKLEALTRYLEVEDMQAAIIFSRTKTYSSEIAEKLQARGYAAAALNGDMQQSMRKKVVERIKSGSLDIIVATDVAARGIDVDRITHVINFDIPHDTESYIHRIGRTGRAGRQGKALLFITPREKRLLKDIERAIKKPIKQIEPPTAKEMEALRIKQLAEKVTGVIEKSKKLKPYFKMVHEVLEQADCGPEEVAAALAYLIQQSNPLSTQELSPSSEPERRERRPRAPRGGKKPGGKKPAGKKTAGRKPAGSKPAGSKPPKRGGKPKPKKTVGTRKKAK